MYILKRLPGAEQCHTVFLEVAFLELAMRSVEDVARTGFGGVADCVVVVFCCGLIWNSQLELRIRQPHLDMVRLLQQPLVQCACTLVFTLSLFKVDVCFPQHFRHIHVSLFDCYFEDAACAVEIIETAL